MFKFHSNSLKNYTAMWLTPLLLVMVFAGCENRMGLMAPPIITTPSVSATNPVNLSDSVAFNQKITATFSESMDSATITTATFTLMQGTSFVSGTVSYTGTTATFSPASALAPNTGYTATLTTGAKNPGGNALAANVVWSFKTGAAAAVIAPTVNSTDPVTAATGVPFNQKIAATFSKSMDAATFTSATFTLKQGSTAVSGFVSYVGTTALFAPASDLAPNTVYTATITTGVKDLAENALANDYVWSFTTGAAAVITPPAVSSIDPANASTGVAFNQKIAATFSTTMDASTITSATFLIKQGTTSVPGFTSYSGTTAIIAPLSNLAPNTVYTVTVTTGAKDLAGNALASDYVWTFTTGAAVVVTPPMVTSTDPTDGAIGVALSKHITATFSKTMDASTITTSTFTLMQGITFVSGTVTYTDTVATYTPSTNLSPNITYTATITTGAKDLGGNSVASNHVWTFTTVVPYTVALSASPLAGGSTSGSGTFISGDSVTVTAAKNVGYTFTSWTENATVVSVNASYRFPLVGNRILVANFARIQYAIALSPDPLAGGTTSGSGTFDSGSSKTVVATPNAGYSFVNWEEGATAVSADSSYTFTLSENRTLTANFILTQYSVTLTSNPAEGGNLYGAGTFNPGTVVTVNTTSKPGYQFFDWKKNGVTVSTNASYTFTLDGDSTLVATYVTGQLPVVLGTSARFAILSDQAITNIPTSDIRGDVGITPGVRSSMDFVLDDPQVTLGAIYAADDAAPTPAMLVAAKADALAGYLDAVNSVRGTPTPASGNLNGLTLVPGLYESGTSMELSPGGLLYLDAKGDSNAVFVFRSATAITTESTSEVVLAGNARASNIYWVAGSAITLGTSSKMKGTVIASTSISLLTGARLDGRALIQGAAAGQVSLDQNIIILP